MDFYKYCNEKAEEGELGAASLVDMITKKALNILYILVIQVKIKI